MEKVAIQELITKKQKTLAELKKNIDEKCGKPKQVELGGKNGDPIFMGYKTPEGTDSKECNRMKNIYNLNQAEIKLLELQEELKKQ